MIELYLIRHGESEANTIRKYIGGRVSNSILTPKGIYQAKRLKRILRINNIKFDVIYSSSAIRAISTACLSVNPENSNINYFENLEEITMGDWSGKLRSKIYTPEVLEQIKKEQLDFKAPNGESQREVADRYEHFINTKVITLENNTKVAIYGHGYAFKCWLQRTLNFDWQYMFPMVLNNCSITKLSYDKIEKLWQINYINHTEDIQ
mgnify:CR=1 FL=1